MGTFAALQSIPTTSNCSFGDIAIAPSGAVVQVCENPTGGQGPATLRVNIDPDGLGPMGFGATITATTTNVGGFDFIPAQNSRSVDAEAGLAFDANPSSPTFGRLYLVYTEEPTNENHDTQILVRTSTDTGATWSAPVQVNDDATTRSQFLPKIASDPTSGAISVCWHDARNSASNNQMQLFCSVANAAAGTPVFATNKQVSDGISQSNGSGVEFGDYMGLAFGSGVAHPVWADTSNSTGDNPNGTTRFDAYTDKVSVNDPIFLDGFESGNTSAWAATLMGPPVQASAWIFRSASVCWMDLCLALLGRAVRAAKPSGQLPHAASRCRRAGPAANFPLHFRALFDGKTRVSTATVALSPSGTIDTRNARLPRGSGASRDFFVDHDLRVAALGLGLGKRIKNMCDFQVTLTAKPAACRPAGCRLRSVASRRKPGRRPAAVRSSVQTGGTTARETTLP
ncbi:MAG: exo-alpha-sialidase [Thermoanaerobaculia bacterium]|nr:exo-alpha-sialidase [Thermoanaerobaculia bacterium]